MNYPLLMTLPSVSLEQMQEAARMIAQVMQAGDVITLKGEFGAGKTTFARALIQRVATDAPVVASPTFNLMQSYDIGASSGTPETLWHLDLCRLKSADEAEALGLRELWAHRVLIEWPEIIEHLLPENHLNITFDFPAAEDIRSLSFYGNDTWRGRLEALHRLV